ncbi:hypothetical protein ACS0TY_006337 [Phlomoides rotata]
MHGCASASVFIVNAEADSMGGVVEGGVGIANKTSPQKVAIEKVQAELRQECDVRDERKRELEFLEKGGNPLDFKLGFSASVSVQSTSITDQHPDQFVTSEVKGSFAFTASPHGDSVESSGRPGTTPWEPNSADNLMLFDAEHESSEGGRSLLHRSNVVPSEQSIQMLGGCKTLEHGDSAVFGVPRKAYKRRYRSRPNRDGTRSSSTDVNSARGCHGSSLPSRHAPKDVKGLTSDAEQQNTLVNWNSNPTSPIKEILPKTIFTDGQDNIELDGLKSFKSTKDQNHGVSLDTTSDAIASKTALDEQLNQQSVSAAAEAPKQVDSNGPEAIQVEGISSAVIECQPSVTAVKVDNQSSSCQMNGFSRKTGDDVKTDAHNSTASRGTKVLDSEPSCTHASLSIDGNNDGEMCTIVRNVDSNGNLKIQSVQDGTPATESDKFAKEKKGTEGIDSSTLVNKDSNSACQSQNNDVLLQPKKELDKIGSALENKVNDQVIVKGTEATGPTQLESERIPANPTVDNPGLQNGTSTDVRHKDSAAVSNSDLPEAGLLTMVSTGSLEAQTSPGSDSKLALKIYEDSILKEAQIIEAKRKRIKELPDVPSPVEICQKSHWNYVLEEMAWLANDFAQERIWKVAAASQISHRVAVTCRLRKNEKNSCVHTITKRIAHTLAKAVLEFWHNVEFQVQEKSQELEQPRQKNGTLSVQAYAVRFLKSNKPNIFFSQAEVPSTPDRVSDSGITDLSWEDSLTEDNLFYTIPAGAMETYRMAIESHVTHCEKIGSAMQEEVETSAFDAAVEFESQAIAYYEDEGETNTYNMSVAFDDSKSSRYGQKKHKHLTYAYGARSYEMGSDLLPIQCVDNKVVTPQSGLLAKRPGSDLNVSIPTKRVRTATRRVISPFGAGASACIQVPNKTDASSCDTNSFQDDQSTLRGGLLVQNNVEVESAGEFEKQLPFDSAEVSTRPKKKKKAKHPNAAYDQRWQIDSSFQNEQFQRDYMHKRSESHQLESNGNSGLLGQPIAKKPKLMRQHDNSYDNIPPSGGSVASPVGSQISNMSNPNKFIKMLGGRDRGRKAKALKMSSGQPGSGSPWSPFEDQALVVLAHDLGPNWELVSDAFNSTLQFKFIFRKAKECKERHISLMDRTPGDGADSAEDSGSSQPYPSTLPGIPKGSARQLFQRLQGPVEEETLKSHFEKIIMIGQKQHYRKTQDPKQFQQPHSSHTIALSQVCPNNLSGGPILTPLDLSEASPFNGPEVISLGYQGAHSSGLPIPNQGTVAQMLPASGASSALPVTSNMMIGNNFSSSPGALNSSARHAVPRSDDHHRVHLYNQMVPGRNVPQPNTAAPGALPGADRGVRMLPSGSGMGIMSGVNRSMPMARPGFQGIPASSMVNSSGVGSPGIASPNMHAGVGAAQGSSMARPREGLPMMRPGPIQDSQRPTTSQGASHFGGLSSPFPNQTASPPVASYPLHHQPSNPISPQQPQALGPHQPHFQGPANHVPNPQQQAYAMRLAKERHMQQRLLQQQQYAASNPLMSHTQSQPQLPISSPMQNSSQVQPQTSSPQVLTSTPSMNTMPQQQQQQQQQQKHQTPAQGVARNAQAGGSGLTNPTGKPRQRPQHQFSQANRQHPQHRQQLQSKAVKGVGRGNPMMHQNIPVDVSLSNGVSTNPGNQCLEKGEPATNSAQSQGLYTGSTQNAVQPTRQYTAPQSNQTLPQQKMYSGPSSLSSKHLQQTSQPVNSSQGHVPPVSPPVLLAGQQSSPSMAIAGSNNQKPVNKNQSAPQRPVQPNRQINSGPSVKQGREFDAEQHPASSSAEIDTMTTLPKASNNASNAVQGVSQPSVHNWHSSEPLSDMNALKTPTNLSEIVSRPSNSSESVSQSGQGLGQRPPTSLPLTRNDVGAQWQQQQQSQLQEPPSPAPQPQQQQAQLLQAGSGNLYGNRSSDSRLE